MNIEEILSEIPIFQGLDFHLITELTPYLKSISYKVHERVIEEGTPGDSMYIILDGAVIVTKSGDDEKEILISQMGSGSYFGELSLLDNQPRSANVSTSEPSTLLVLTRDSFDQLIAKNKEFAVQFYQNCLQETISRIRETANNLTLSQEILNQKSVRLDKIDADLTHAKRIQDYINNTTVLKDNKRIIDGLTQTYFYQPYLEVGGDFVNFHKISPTKLSFIIADVMGHGIAAAMATGVLRSAFAFFEKEYAESPSVFLYHMNKHLVEVFNNLFATAYFVHINFDSEEIILSNAGHLRPLYWSTRENKLIDVELKGPGLGIIKETSFEELRISFEKGDRMLFYTDGMVEQRNCDGEMYGIKRLQEDFIVEVKKKTDQIEIDDLLTKFHDFCGTMEFQDDVTLLLLEF